MCAMSEKKGAQHAGNIYGNNSWTHGRSKSCERSSQQLQKNSIGFEGMKRIHCRSTCTTTKAHIHRARSYTNTGVYAILAGTGETHTCEMWMISLISIARTYPHTHTHANTRTNSETQSVLYIFVQRTFCAYFFVKQKLNSVLPYEYRKARRNRDSVRQEK